MVKIIAATGTIALVLWGAFVYYIVSFPPDTNLVIAGAMILLYASLTFTFTVSFVFLRYLKLKKKRRRTSDTEKENAQQQHKKTFIKALRLGAIISFIAVAATSFRIMTNS